ncbi:MAG: hypothetical protein IJT18_04190 [Oscillospiraceae bacterium]|nr:hypothetical protein [Oscillospiraceae bacterium]
MTDLHTHILPAVDDGARDVQTSIAMLTAAKAQGVDAVALTPHFYLDHRTPQEFLARRQRSFDALRSAIDALPAAEREALPPVTLGAEVLWMPYLSRVEGLEKLCYEGTRLLLLEPPFGKWGSDWFRDLNDIIDMRGLIPVIAHIDRYAGAQSRGAMDELRRMGLPTQISAEAFTVRRTRAWALAQIKSGAADLLISDCHNTTDRKPNTGDALEVIGKKLGEDAAQMLREKSDRLLKRK